MRPSRSHRTSSPRYRRRVLAALACLGLLSGTVAGCGGDDGPDSTLKAFLLGWPRGDLHDVGFVAPAGGRIPASDVAEQIKQLSGELADHPPALSVSGKPQVNADVATAKVTVDWTLPGKVHWRYPTTVRLSHAEQGWQVIWEPKIVQPRLTAGDALALTRLPSPRAGVLDGSGDPIVKPRPVVAIGIEPSKVTDITDLVQELDAAFKSIGTPLDLSDLPERVTQAKPNAFVEVVTLRRPAYDKIRSRIRPLNGTVFREERWQLAPTRQFARALLGSVDDVTKEDMQKNPGMFLVGDQVGHGGLQGRYDERLRGTPGIAVVIRSKAPDGKINEDEVYRHEAAAGTPLKTTLDPAVQQAADAVLGTDKHRSALVAIRISDGHVLAVANGPDGGGQNLAFTARVPPGSTFKTVTALGLLEAGALDQNTPVDCPKTLTVDGRSFKNAHDFSLGTVPFHTDFAKSCNTAFASLAPKLGPDGLAKAGGRLGIGRDWDMGIDAFTGKVSTGGSGAERAAAAFGQGTTVVSPLAMAGAVAAVARGRWTQPVLLRDPTPATADAGPRLDDAAVRALHAMMREVVTAGTATALRSVPGKPVYGKTGTAEYDDNPEHTHAWFVGWQGDIAFAVFVEQGGDSGTSAVPLAGRFLRALS